MAANEESQGRRFSRAGPQQRDEAPEPVDVALLLRGRRAVRLRVGREEYRLTLTRNGKLILTK